MTGRLVASVCLSAVAVLVAAPRAFGQTAGLPPEWEFRKDIRALVEQTDRLKPLLEAVKPEDWTAKGAPDAYLAQWKSVVAQLGYAVGSAGELDKEPERLTLALETYFRVQSLDAMLVSLNEGIARYQNPALADLIRGVMADGGPAREKLRQYIVQLATLKEQQFKVVDQEAQRCRTRLLQQAPPRKQGAQK